jgi:hypothetical protein
MFFIPALASIMFFVCALGSLICMLASIGVGLLGIRCLVGGQIVPLFVCVLLAAGLFILGHYLFIIEWKY